MTQPAATRLTRQYNVFISYARADGRDLANRLYMALQDNGLRPWRDGRNLNLGRDYTIEIERAIRAADYVVVLLTSDVAVRKEDSFVNCEILEAQARGKPIIPLITRGFDPVDVPIQIKHLTWMPFADFDTDLPRLLERFSEAPGYFAEPPPSDDPFHPYVERMRDFVIAELGCSLLDLDNPLPLSMRDASHATSVPPLPVAFKSRVLHHNLSVSTAPPERRFDDFNQGCAAFDGRVLLLGEPGAGKTTILLAFARAKAITRLVYPAAPLPVYAPLASWDGESELADWLARTTGLEAAALRTEIAAKRALLILDGLDEMAVQLPDSSKPDRPRRDFRVEFLARLQSIQTPTVVSCRVKDYHDIVARGGEKIPLNGAVTLQPLTTEHIKAYLKDQPELWDALQADADLLDAARTPLLLSLLAFGYRDSTADDRAQLRDLSRSPDDLRDRLFERYIAERYEHEQIRTAEPLPYTREELVEKLGRAIVAMLSDTGGRFDYTLLGESDFSKPDRVALTELAVRLHLLKPAERGILGASFGHQELRWRCHHKLLRDYLGFRRAITDLGDAGENVRIGAALALGKLGEPRAVTALVTALSHAIYSNSYTYIASALTQLEDPRAVEELIAALADSDRFVRLYAADALGNIGNVRGVEALIAALRDPDGSVRSNAANALRRIGDARAVEPLLAALSDPDSFVRWSVADTLGQLGDIRAVEPLIAALGDPDSFVRRSAADALGQLRDHHAVEPLITALLGPDSFVRASAARALGQIGDACAVEPLKKLLSDDALGTRLKSRTGIKRVYDYAVEALERIGTPEALAVLKQWRRG
jgi:HEAT repeat protein